MPWKIILCLIQLPHAQTSNQIHNANNFSLLYRNIILLLIDQCRVVLSTDDSNMH